MLSEWKIKGALFDFTNKVRMPKHLLWDGGWSGTPYTDMFERYTVHQHHNGVVTLYFWGFTIGDIWCDIYCCVDTLPRLKAVGF